MLRNKIIALTMVLMMLVGMTLSVNAAEPTVEEKAQVLYDLGLFSGVSTTAYSPNLEGSANREQAAKMVVVALGLDIVASDVSGFGDVSQWAQPYVSRAVSEGITNGISATEFGASQSITARQLATWFDRVITKSTSAWEDNATLDNAKGINRGDLVSATYDALKQTPVGASESLIETIVANNANLLKIATDGNLIEEEPSVAFDYGQPAYIRSINVVNEKLVKITMSNVLDEVSSEIIANYKVYTINGALNDPIESVMLSKVNEVTVLFKDSLSGHYIIAMDGMMDSRGNEVDDNEGFQVGNTRGILGIEVTKDNQIAVTFTVDVEESSAEDIRTYEVTDKNGNELEILRARWTDGNKVYITFEEVMKQGRAYSLNVSGLDADEGSDISDSKDFYGHEVIREVKVTAGRKIVVTFSDDVMKSSAEDKGNYQLKDSLSNSYTIESIDLTDNDEVTITFDDYLDSGSYTLTVNGIEDVDGTDIDDEVDFNVD